jgi:D-alanine-D-alanine ligase
MEKRKVTILYDAIEDRHQEEAKERGEKLKPLVSEEIERVLAKRGHEVRRLAASADPAALARALSKDSGDAIFNVCEAIAGVNQQEQNVAALLELFGKRYTGAPPIGLALAQDKALAKKILQFHGIRTPKFMVMHAGALDHADALEFPLFVKPSNEDASIGIDAGSVVRDLKELMERISYVQTEFGAPALVEEFIDGRELYVSLIGNGEALDVLPLTEMVFAKDKTRPEERIATQSAKWDEEYRARRGIRNVFARPVSKVVRDRIDAICRTAFRVLWLRDYARLDVRLAPDGEVWFLEANANPFISYGHDMANAAEKAGMDYYAFVERLVHEALGRYDRA